MSLYSEKSHNIKQIIIALEDNLLQINSKNIIQRQLCLEYVTIFEKFSKNLYGLSAKINEHVAKLEGKNSETVATIFKYLTISLNKVAVASKDIAIKGKNQIIDPLKLFTDNCTILNRTFLAKLREKENQINQRYSQLFKAKEKYIQFSERLGKKSQGKLMNKIESGSSIELEKFNNNIRKITESIKLAEEQYTYMVKNVNVSFDSLKQEIQEISSSIAISQESRINFTRKSLVCSIKNLKDFMTESDSQEIQKKLEEELERIKTYNNQSILNVILRVFQGSLSIKIGAIVDSQEKEEFVSYEDIQRKKRKKLLQEQNTHLNEIFSKVKEEDKNIMRVFIKNWFVNEQKNKKQNQNSQEVTAKEWETCREKILSVLPYSYFFIETIYQEIIEMSSIYCKLDEQNFFILLDVFCRILQNMKLGEKTSGSASSISIQFVYRMVHTSMRVMWKKNSSSRSQPIELLCQHLGKKSKQLQNQQIFIKLNDFLQKKKVQKKTTTSIESPKGMMDSLMKGMQQAMNMKKQIKLTQEEHFGCLTELTYIMANLLTPNEIGIPTLRKLLGKGENTRSFQYLKSILFEKKDQLERQKVFFRTQIKQRMEKRMNEIIKSNKIAQECLKITARTGFLCQSQLNLRLVCKQLQNVHQQILYRLDITPQKKWPHLIPFDRSLKYAELKQLTISKGLPQATEQIIILDVNRSLHNHTQLLSQQTLRTLLRVYGFKHADIGYCQGMNYIAGYLYLKVKDEQTGYRMFEYLMENRFRELFANEFEVLKVKLYQFERLLAIFHPEIGDHFKKQGITAECYIVAWIITIFASSYQYTMESYLIDLLWERFIISGWSQFYRFVLALFSIHKQEIIELTYDKAMHFLGGMAKSDILISNKDEYMEKHAGQKLEEMMEQFQISEQLLLNLEKEYELREI